MWGQFKKKPIDLADELGKCERRIFIYCNSLRIFINDKNAERFVDSDGGILLLRIYSFISSMVCFLMSSFGFISFFDAFSEDLRILNLINYGIHAQGVLAEERDNGARSYAYFVASYEVGNRTYEFDWIDWNDEYKLNDTIAVIYNRRNPSDYIVEGFNKSELIWTIIFGLLFGFGPILIAIFLLYDFYKIGYLEKNGIRILCEVVSYRWSRYSIPYITVICKIPTDDKKKFKRYKGACGWMFNNFMEKNHLKYIPLYISKEHSNMYYVNCDELKKIVKYKSYNGHIIEELQGL